MIRYLSRNAPEISGRGQTRRRLLSLEDWQAAMAVLAFVPMAEAARPLLVQQFDRYLSYGMPVDQPIDAPTLVDRIYAPLTGEVADATTLVASRNWTFLCAPPKSA